MKHWTTWIVAGALVLGACKSKDKQPEADPAGSSETGAAAEQKPAPAADKPGVELFAGSAPALPPPVDKLAIGMTAAEAKAAAPAVFEAKYGYAVPGYTGVKVRVQISDKIDRVYVVRFEIDQPVDAVKAALAAKWGEPRAVKNSIGDPLYFWDHADTGVRAKLEASASRSNLIFGSVMSTQQFVGSTPGRLGFEKQPLLGATKDEVLAAYATWGARAKDDDPDTLTIALPPLDTSEYNGWITPKLKDGKVTGYTVQISFSWDPATKQALLAGLEAAFGKPKGKDMYVDFPGPPKVKVDQSNETQIVIWVADYK